MKKKSLITMLVTLTLVAAVGIGATLAYMTDTTATLTNTFTVGAGLDADLVEEDEDDNVIEEGGIDFEGIQPGDELVKEPYMIVNAGSNKCYVFIKVTGIDALEAMDFEVTGFDAANWVKKANVADGDVKDGIYQYVGPQADENHVVDASEAAVATEKLFTTVTYSVDVEEVNETALPDIVLVGCVVQATNVTEAVALEEAVFE